MALTVIPVDGGIPEGGFGSNGKKVFDANDPLILKVISIFSYLGIWLPTYWPRLSVMFAIIGAAETVLGNAIQEKSNIKAIESLTV